MTPREIKFEDVRVGDRVRWSHKTWAVEACVVDLDTTDSELPVKVAIGPRFMWMDVEGATVTLLDRSLPPIPTEEGTVIRHKVSGHLYARLGGDWRYGGNGSPLDVSVFVTREHFDALVPEQVDQ